MIDNDLLLRMSIRVNDVLKRQMWLWVDYVKVVFQKLLLLLTLGIEFELLLRTFQGMAGEDHQYWTPGLMALTGVIMISAFHLLATTSKDNAFIRLIHRAAPFLIGFYLVGMGLLTTSIIGQDASGALLDTPFALVIGEPSTAEVQQHWLSAFISDTLSPIALSVFSFGVGGLAIVNLLVAHVLIGSIKKSWHKIRNIKPEADRLKNEQHIVKTACSHYHDQQAALHDINLWSTEQIRHEAALQLAALIHSVAAKHRRYLKGKEVSPNPSPIDLKDPVDPKIIERDLKKIEAMDFKAILRTLQSYTPKGV
ncbi:MAG: hypothetical protein ACRBB4_15670 [Neptuniibacter sp.]